MIKIIDVSKVFKNEVIYENVTFDINEGDRVLFVGENGSGKSVLMKMIVGFSRPTKGRIEIDGEVLGENVDFIQNAGVYINSPEFLGTLTGVENLLYLANIKKISSEEDIMNYAKLLYFEEDIKKKYKVFSLGMKQKLRFIQAFLDKPKYLILDEPFDAVDKKSKLAMLQILEAYIDDTRALIYTTHSIDYQKFATKTYRMDADEKIVVLEA